MEFYEIKNTKTQQTTQIIAKNFSESCKVQGWKPRIAVVSGLPIPKTQATLACPRS